MKSLYESILDTDTEITKKSAIAAMATRVKTAIESVFGPLVPDKGKYARKKLIGEVDNTYFDKTDINGYKIVYWNKVDNDIDKVFKQLKKEGIKTSVRQSRYHYSIGDLYKYFIDFSTNIADIEIEIKEDMIENNVEVISFWTYDKYIGYFI